MEHLIAQVTVPTPLGEMLLAATDRGLAGTWFSGQRWHPGPLTVAMQPEHPLLREARRQLRAYFAQYRLSFDVPLDLSWCGTPFQQAVWALLRSIPPGSTCSYGELARRLDRPGAARAVGSAVGRNPLLVWVPCHRVTGAGGALTGYAAGLDRQSALLGLEHANC